MLFPARRADRPNLLFLWADQQRPDTMRVYGNARIHAPNFNRLSEECAVFEHAYVSQPVCTPSRSTVMTGLWPHANGCVTNNIPLPERISCVPEILADPEYRTGYYGKWHLGDELFAQHGFEEWESIEDIYHEYFRPGKDRSLRSTYDRFLREKGYKPDSPDGTFSRLYEAHMPIEHCKPRFLELKAIDFLRRHRNEPFILYVNFLEPHPPYYGPLNDEHKVGEMELPPNHALLTGEDQPIAYRIKSQRDRQLRPEGMDLRTDDGWRRFIANYWGNVTHIDGSIGAILRTLEELGLAENTIVVHTSDHGEMLGSHSMAQKGVMYEQAVKVPWLIRAPRIGKKLRLVSGRFSHIDIVPTVLDLMGRPISGRLPGRSLVPVMRGNRRTEPVFVEWNAAAVGNEELQSAQFSPEVLRKALSASTRAVITQDGWKLSLSTGDKHQLFNLQSDPWEMKNLFYAGQHRDVIDRLTERIHRWQKEVKDTVNVSPG
jgi:arylsulfatase A-like enzyme